MKKICLLPFSVALLSGIAFTPAYGQLANPPVVTTGQAPALTTGQPQIGVAHLPAADLQIVNLVFPATFNQADRINYSFALKNNGPGGVSFSPGMRFYSIKLDGREVSSFDAMQPQVLAPSESMPFRGNLPAARDWFSTAGSHTLSITADPNNSITESSKANNTVTQVVNVAALPVSDVIYAGAVVDPPHPTTTTPMKVSVTVTNRGPGEATFDGRIVDSPDCPGVNSSTNFQLQAGASRTFEIPAPREWYQAGNKTCSVVIGAVQNDPDLSNNRGSFSFTVRQAVAAMAAPAAQQSPDLQIVNVVFPASFNQADRLDYSFALKNNGPGAANIPINMRFYSIKLDGREVSSFDAMQPQVLAAGESMPFRGNLPMARDWFSVAGSHTLSLTADPNNTIAEANENNNTATQAVNVTALAVSDVIFAGAVVSPPNPTIATPMKVTVTVSNRGPGEATFDGSIVDSPDCPGVNTSTNFHLQAGASRAFEIPAPRDWYQVGTKTCTVVIGGVQNDPDLSNNRGSFSFTVAR